MRSERLKPRAPLAAPMRILVPLLVLGVALAGCATNPPGNGSDDFGGGSNTTTTTTTTTPPTAGGGGAEGVCTSTKESGVSAANPTWVMETSKGTIRITLFCDKTPITAQNIVKLTEAGCYDGTKFHRVIRDFMDQGGDPLSKDDAQAGRWGTGGPSDCGQSPDTIVDEFYCADGSLSKTHPATCPNGALGLKHDKAGVVSMANTGRPQTGGSQFFLTAVPTPWLDGKHAIFGEAADQASLDVILAINKSPTATGDRPNPPIVLTKATIAWG